MASCYGCGLEYKSDWWIMEEICQAVKKQLDNLEIGIKNFARSKPWKWADNILLPGKRQVPFQRIGEILSGPPSDDLLIKEG